MTTTLAGQWRRRDTRVSASRALSSTTRASIYERLRESAEPLTVRDVADRFDLHPNVARTHLEMLADAGLLVVGRRKHPGGGRPAKVYRVADAADPEGVPSPVGDQAAARLQVRLLAELVEGNGSTGIEARALEAGVAEGRQLTEPLAPDEPLDLDAAAELVVRALRPHVSRLRVVKREDEWVDLAGVGRAFELVTAVQPRLSEAFQQGLLQGAFEAAGRRVTVAGAGALTDGDRVLRVRVGKGAGGSRTGPRPLRRVDARGMPREQGVVRAMREVTGLRTGQVLEILAEGPGSPAAFARWADRAGHELLGVERATDQSGRSAIRLLIRKGRA